MGPLELTRSGVIASVALFVVAAICVRLGVWQLDRRDERSSRNAAIESRATAPLVPLKQLPVDTAGLTFRRATIEGRYDHGRAVVLAGRSHLGAPGAHVYTPLLLGDGAVLVNRGWLPAPDAATVDLEAVRRPDSARVEGVLMPIPDAELDLPDEGFRTTWFRVDAEALRAQYPYPVAPLYLLATSAPAREDPGTTLVRASLPSVDPGPHLSYALQWFSFAAILVIGWCALVLRWRGGRERGAGGAGVG